MSVSVAGQSTVTSCSANALATLGVVWHAQPDGSWVCDAPGVYVVEGAIHFVLPRCYGTAAPTGAAALRAALTLLGALARYRVRPEQRAIDESAENATIHEIGAVDDALAWLEVALMLLDDADRNGPLYVATSDVSPRRLGRIHWAKTQHLGFHVVDGAEVMSSPIWRCRHGIDPEDALTRLHLDTCSAIRRSLGRGGEDRRTWTSPEALSVLNRREHTLYADRNRRVARWLREYWTARSGGLASGRAGISALWSPKFPLVWEEMLRAVMRGRSFGMPRGTYYLSGGAQAGLRLVPDFVVDHEGVRLVIDAKHYGLEDMPSTGSLAKQLLYRWFTSRESGHGAVPIAAVKSVFILPIIGGEIIEWLGAHELEGEKDVPDAFGRVTVLAADFEMIATAYVSDTVLPQLAHAAVSPAGHRRQAVK